MGTRLGLQLTLQWNFLTVWFEEETVTMRSVRQHLQLLGHKCIKLKGVLPGEGGCEGEPGHAAGPLHTAECRCRRPVWLSTGKHRNRKWQRCDLAPLLSLSQIHWKQSVYFLSAPGALLRTPMTDGKCKCRIKMTVQKFDKQYYSSDAIISKCVIFLVHYH